MIIGAFVLILIGSGIGSSGAKATIHNKEMDITALDKEIDKLKKELSSMKEDRDEAKAIIDKNGVSSKRTLRFRN